MENLTLDTGLLIKIIDKSCGALPMTCQRGHESALQICQWHAEGKVAAFVSSRLFNPDSVKMDVGKRGKIRKFLEMYNIEMRGSGFRLGISPLSGSDMLSGGSTRRTKEEMELFRAIVGNDPTQLPLENVGKRLSNKIGDYDSLYEHYCQKRDIFLTFDSKDYLHVGKRPLYETKLGLVILNPEEYVRRNPQFNI